MIEESEIIGNILAEMSRRRWTQEYLAKRANIGRNTLSDAKLGKRHLKLSIFLRIAKALEMDPRELMAEQNRHGGR